MLFCDLWWPQGYNLCKLFNIQEERVKVDIEEAKFQAEKRKEAIERAKTLLYYQTDRIKKFHVSHTIPLVSILSHIILKGALKLSEVLAEREQQVLRKKEKKGLQKKIDARFLAMEQEVWLWTKCNKITFNH